jgi:hypothetical protein
MQQNQQLAASGFHSPRETGFRFMQVDLTTEQAIQLVKENGYIVAFLPRVTMTSRCITVMVMGDGGPRPVRIHRKSDGKYAITLDGVGLSNEPVVAKRAWRMRRKIQRDG